MIDLTKIEKPFGLLDPETQKALRECGGPWEYYGLFGWANHGAETFSDHLAYRQKPQPREYEAWMVVLGGGAEVCVTRFRSTAEKEAQEISGRVIRMTGRDE